MNIFLNRFNLSIGREDLEHRKTLQRGSQVSEVVVLTSTFRPGDGGSGFPFPKTVNKRLVKVVVLTSILGLGG
jgi:hypothetical protein